MGDSDRLTIASRTALELVYTLSVEPARSHQQQLDRVVSEVVLRKLADRQPIYRAAALIHRSPGYIMDMVNAGLVKAYRIGGSLKKPWLSVDMSELIAAIDRETLYVPPPLKTRRPMRRRIEYENLHPLAASL